MLSSAPCMRCASTPQPDCTAMYWTPSTAKELGTPVMPELVRHCHSGSPVFPSKARKNRSLVPPAKTRPPPVELREDRLLDVGLGVDEGDGVGAPFQYPQVAVAAGVHQALDGPAAPLNVHQDRRRHLVPVPGVVPVVLVMRAQLAAVRVQRDDRGGIEIVPGALIAHPLGRVSRAPVSQVE